jgi:hypothetical protein
MEMPENAIYLKDLRDEIENDDLQFFMHDTNKKRMNARRRERKRRNIKFLNLSSSSFVRPKKIQNMK